MAADASFVRNSRLRATTRDDDDDDDAEEDEERKIERDSGASGNEFSFVSYVPWVFLGFCRRCLVLTRRERISRSSATTIAIITSISATPSLSPRSPQHPRFIPEKALIKGATMLPVTVSRRELPVPRSRYRCIAERSLFRLHPREVSEASACNPKDILHVAIARDILPAEEYPRVD